MESGNPKPTNPVVPEAANVPAAPNQSAAQSAPTSSKSRLRVQEELEAANPRDRGFDPYNSGSFNIKDTWSRVNRKK